MEIVEKSNIKLKKDAFRLVSGIENEKSAEKEILNILNIKLRHGLFNRRRFNIAEKEAIEAVFAKYGVTENIWEDAD